MKKYPFLPEIRAKINKNSIRIQDLAREIYIKPRSMHFMENGAEKTWDILDGMDSVSALLYHRDLSAFIIVRQFRPAVFLAKNNLFKNPSQILNADLSSGYTYELCAGLADKNMEIEKIMVEEIFEECGYEISVENLQKIGVFHGGTSMHGNVNHLFFAEISQKDFRHAGGGIDDECIDVIALPLQYSLEFAHDDEIAKTTGLSFAITWYHFKKGRV